MLDTDPAGADVAAKLSELIQLPPEPLLPKFTLAKLPLTANACPEAVPANVGATFGRFGCQGLVMKKGSFEPPPAETVTLSKIDDQSILFRRFKNEQFTEFGQQLRYCPDKAQRAYIESKKTK